MNEVGSDRLAGIDDRLAPESVIEIVRSTQSKNERALLQTTARRQGDDQLLGAMGIKRPEVLADNRENIERLNPQTGQWARGLNLYGRQTAPQPTATTGDR